MPNKNTRPNEELLSQRGGIWTNADLLFSFSSPFSFSFHFCCTVVLPPPPHKSFPSNEMATLYTRQVQNIKTTSTQHTRPCQDFVSYSKSVFAFSKNPSTAVGIINECSRLFISFIQNEKQVKERGNLTNSVCKIMKKSKRIEKDFLLVKKLLSNLCHYYSPTGKNL